MKRLLSFSADITILQHVVGGSRFCSYSVAIHTTQWNLNSIPIRGRVMLKYVVLSARCPTCCD